MTSGAEAVRRIIEGAEEPPDPLKELIERTRADAGAPFVPETLARLAALKQEDRAAFETLRAQLKKAGCRMAALDEAVAEENGGPVGRGPTHADILISLAGDADLFHAADSKGYADLDINEHRETWPIRSTGFRRWLAHRFYEASGGAPNSEAMQSALGVIEARAHFSGPQRAVFIRVGTHEGLLYLDLANDAWSAVEIGPAGWRIVEKPPVRFRRAAGMRPLPSPTPGGDVNALRPFLNVASDGDFVLAVAWLLGALSGKGPYPILVLSGEQGSAKSSFSAMLRFLIDPNTAPLRALPREDRDLFIAATHGHVLAFDNVSGLPAWISDTLCRLATGGGFATRQLYTDEDETLFDASRPIILNGIEDIVTRPDLADRALFLVLEPIPEERRRPERELWAAVERERPRLLGALLDAVAEGLRRLPSTTLQTLPRMADFALWVTACETAVWPAGTFAAAYGGNREDAVESVIEADPVAMAVRALMEQQTEWTGTASTLLGALGEIVGDLQRKAKSWPDSPRALSGRLRRAATFLRSAGIAVIFIKEKGRKRTRTIQIRKAPENPVIGASAPSADPKTPAGTDDADDADGADGADATGGPASAALNMESPAGYRSDERRAEFEERAAIAEFDGGLDRAEAERLAAGLALSSGPRR